VLAVVVIGGGELLVVASMRVFAQRIVRRLGGWRVTLGLGWIADRDWQPWAIGLALLLGGRLVVNGAAAALTHGTAVKQAQNVQLHHPTVLGVSILSLLLLVIAPLVEETLFRGVILRCFLRRLTFWPAALLSTGIFALLHVYEVDTLAGRATLAVNVGVLGLVNCILVRVSGRLTPGIMLHTTNNLLAFFVLLGRAG
jgi:hypothetical protein